jgi:RHS repeat-associated protein
MPRTWRSHGSLAIGLLLFGVSCAAQAALTETEEWARRIKSSEAIAALGSDLFGDSTSFYDGSTTFSVTDIDLPGNNALPVRMTRTLTAASADTIPTYVGTLMGYWDLDLPYISGVFSKQYGWKLGGSQPYARCSRPDEPVSLIDNQGITWDYWAGNFLHVPGRGTHALLVSYRGARPSDGQTTTMGTIDFAQVRCGVALANSGSAPGFSGEGFQVLTTDGTTYTFDWMTTRGFSTLVRGGGLGTSQQQLGRVEVRLYPTRVQDRFGNTVTYHWTGTHLDSITASDGRAITFGYNANDRIATATANGRTWQYSYVGSTSSTLTSVVLPDNSSWTLSTSQLNLIYDSTNTSKPPCNLLKSWESGIARTFVFKHPSGATGEFTFSPTRHGRTRVSNKCFQEPGTNYIEYGPPILRDTFALTHKKLYGPGLPAQDWSMSYSAAVGGYADCCAPDAKTVTVTNPDASSTVYTYGTRYYLDEGKLLHSQTYDPAGTLVRDESHDYAINPASPPYPAVMGALGLLDEDAFADTHVVPRTRTTLSQEGDSYTNAVNSFDSFAREVSVTRSNSFGGTRTDVTAYYDDLSKWVIGQIKTLTNTNTGVVVSQTDYDPASAKPSKTYVFGLAQLSFTYNTDGTLKAASDGLSRTTTLSNWKRGAPQRIDFPDSTYKTAVVDDNGWVSSATDARGNTTAYGYDPVGRLKALTYPANDTVSWAAKNITYAPLTADELGIPAGSWRARSTEGRMQKSIYYDARWQPVLTEERDTSTGAARYSKQVYDYAGRATFQSYPSTSSGPTSGTSYSYDALGRLKTKAVAGGVTLQTVNYLSGNRQQVMDAAGNSTTTSYQAFDAPGADRPTLIQAPEGQTTTINRSLFGEISSVVQSGAEGSVTDSYVYDGYHRLCKRIEPETGQTVIAYDAASQIAWTAKGQSGSTTACDYASVPASAQIKYDYYPTGLQKTITYPDSTGNVGLGYDNDGHLTSASNPTATWSYAWNKRGLLETEQAVIDGKIFVFDPGYDVQGHLAQMAYPDGRTVAYAPDAWGRPTQVGSYASGVQYWPNSLTSSYTLGNGLSYSQTLDARLRPYNVRVSNGGTGLQNLTYAYTDDNDLRAITDGIDGADSASFGYDGLHRLTSASGLWGSYSYAYDAFNNLRTRSGGANLLAYNYDAATNRLASVTLDAPTLQFSVNPATLTAGGSSTLSWTSQYATACSASGAWSGSKATSGSQSVTPSSTSTYALSCSGAGGSVSQSATVTVNAAPPPVPTLTLTANPATIVKGGSSTLSWSSTKATSCTATDNWSGTKPLSGSQAVSPTKVGTHYYTLTCTGAGGSVARSVDVDVTSSVCPTCLQSAAAGTSSAALAASPATDANVRQYSYDAQGRIGADGVRSYTWTLADEITRIPGVASYAYDARGMRIKTTHADGTTEYALYDPAGKLLYWESGSVKTDYLSLNGQPLVEVSNGAPRYLHADLLGSPRLASDAGKNTLWREHFDPYGQKLNGVADKIGYTGHAYDAESGLTYAGARFYDAQVGRFLSGDPASFNGTNPFSFNRYAYANNSPYHYKDPDGQSPIEIGFLIADSIELGSAISSGSGIGLAIANVAIDAVAVASPAPGISEAAHAIEGAAKIADVARGAEKAEDAAKAAISGNAQVTRTAGQETTHASTSERIANEQAARPDAESVHMNQSISTITGGEVKSSLRPDVATVRADGKVDVHEVLSPSQQAGATASKYQNALGSKAGEVKCVQPDGCR